MSNVEDFDIGFIENLSNVNWTKSGKQIIVGDCTCTVFSFKDGLYTYLVEFENIKYMVTTTEYLSNITDGRQLMNIDEIFKKQKQDYWWVTVSDDEIKRGMIIKLGENKYFDVRLENGKKLTYGVTGYEIGESTEKDGSIDYGTFIDKGLTASGEEQVSDYERYIAKCFMNKIYDFRRLSAKQLESMFISYTFKSQLEILKKSSKPDMNKLFKGLDLSLTELDDIEKYLSELENLEMKWSVSGYYFNYEVFDIRTKIGIIRKFIEEKEPPLLAQKYKSIFNLEWLQKGLNTDFKDTICGIASALVINRNSILTGEIFEDNAEGKLEEKETATTEDKTSEQPSLKDYSLKIKVLSQVISELASSQEAKEALNAAIASQANKDNVTNLPEGFEFEELGYRLGNIAYRDSKEKNDTQRTFNLYNLFRENNYEVGENSEKMADNNDQGIDGIMTKPLSIDDYKEYIFTNEEIRRIRGAMEIFADAVKGNEVRQ